MNFFFRRITIRIIGRIIRVAIRWNRANNEHPFHSPFPTMEKARDKLTVRMNKIFSQSLSLLKIFYPTSKRGHVNSSCKYTNNEMWIVIVISLRFVFFTSFSYESDGSLKTRMEIKQRYLDSYRPTISFVLHSRHQFTQRNTESKQIRDVAFEVGSVRENNVYLKKCLL